MSKKQPFSVLKHLPLAQAIRWSKKQSCRWELTFVSKTQTIVAISLEIVKTAREEMQTE